MTDFLLKAALVYVAGVAFLFFYQRNLIYFPDKTRPAPAAFGDNGIVEVVTVISGNRPVTLQGWYVPPPNPEEPVVVFFQGNGGHYGHRLFKVPEFRAAGYGFLLAGYRGYGGNPGTPSEEGLYADARAYIEWLHAEKGVAYEDMILYGESLGSGVAVQMATEFDAGALVLESPYTSLPDVARRTYFFVPVDLLMRDAYRSGEKIGGLTLPVLILHGARDAVIPAALGRGLFDKARGIKEFVSFDDAAHNDLYNHGAARRVIEFLNRVIPAGNAQNVRHND